MRIFKQLFTEFRIQTFLNLNWTFYKVYILLTPENVISVFKTKFSVSKFLSQWICIHEEIIISDYIFIGSNIGQQFKKYKVGYQIKYSHSIEPSIYYENKSISYLFFFNLYSLLNIAISNQYYPNISNKKGLSLI